MTMQPNHIYWVAHLAKAVKKDTQPVLVIAMSLIIAVQQLKVLDQVDLFDSWNHVY